MSTVWYERGTTELYEELRTSSGGLTGAEAARRLSEEGLNTLPEAKIDGYPLIFLRQFQSPLIYLLIAAGAAILFLGEIADGAIILSVLLFNAIVGTFQEGKAQNTLQALKQFVETTATVMRDNTELVISGIEVVRGDVLILREGEKVPADARVMESIGLKVDEAALTGESEPVSKTVKALHNKNLSAAEQVNMVFKGTNIVSGNGRAVVVATGVHTFIGTIAATVSAIDTEMPLKANIRHLSRAIVAVVAVVSTLLFILGLSKGQELVTIFATVVSLAVSVIPEGLPIVITIVLTAGVWRMSKRQVLVKKMQAVEALGQATIIAVDKTGTITKNELVIREVWTEEKTFEVGGVGYEPKGEIMLDGATVDAANHPELLLAGKIATLSANAHTFFSEAESRWRVTGDPTEAAIRVFGEKIGFQKDDLLRESPIISEIPFDYRLKYHAVVSRIEQHDLLIVSGAPEVVLALSTQIRRDGHNHPMRVSDRENIESKIANMSGRGLRIVALAVREKFSESLTPETIEHVSFVGFFGMQDILRPEVAGAMDRATHAGIRVVMITGDHKLTAQAIAKEAGIWHEGDGILTGATIDKMSDPELAVQVDGISVFARVTPEHKLRIINAYKKRGEIIAMTGDGVNDAPPLVAADLGVAMGKIGTEVAKEAADIVLLDDDFGSIVSAVEEGRNIYHTIKKVVLYLFSTSFAEVLIITLALLLGYPLPLLAAQIIWLNFVTDGFLDVALAMEPQEEGLLSGKFARPSKYIVDGAMVSRTIVMALPMAIGTLFLFQHYVNTDIEKAWTMALTVLVVFQWFNVWNCRSERVSLFSKNIFANKYLILATIVVVLAHMLALYTPFLQGVLHTVPLDLSEWAWAIAIATSVIFVEEIRKIISRHHAKPSRFQKPINA